MIKKLLQEKTIRYGLFGIAGVIILIIGLLIPVGHSNRDFSELQADIENLKLSIPMWQNITAEALNNTASLKSVCDNLTWQMDGLSQRLSESTNSSDSLRQKYDINSAEVQQRFNELQSYISALESKVTDLEQFGGMDKDAVKSLQDSFDKLAGDFAVLKANDTGRIEITHATIAGTGYVNNDVIYADVVIVVENKTIYDLKDRKIMVTIKADKDIPPLRTASLYGFNSGWDFQMQEGRFIYFVTSNPVLVPANGVLGLELKMKFTFTQPITEITNFVAEVSLN